MACECLFWAPSSLPDSPFYPPESLCKAKWSLRLPTPRTAAHQAPPSIAFSRQEYWSGVSCPSPTYSITSQISPALLNYNWTPLPLKDTAFSRGLLGSCWISRIDTWQGWELEVGWGPEGLAAPLASHWSGHVVTSLPSGGLVSSLNLTPPNYAAFDYSSWLSSSGPQASKVGMLRCSVLSDS